MGGRVAGWVARMGGGGSAGAGCGPSSPPPAVFPATPVGRPPLPSRRAASASASASASAAAATTTAPVARLDTVRPCSWFSPSRYRCWPEGGRGGSTVDGAAAVTAEATAVTLECTCRRQVRVRTWGSACFRGCVIGGGWGAGVTRARVARLGPARQGLRTTAGQTPGLGESAWARAKGPSPSHGPRSGARWQRDIYARMVYRVDGGGEVGMVHSLRLCLAGPPRASAQDLDPRQTHPGGGPAAPWSRHAGPGPGFPRPGPGPGSVIPSRAGGRSSSGVCDLAEAIDSDHSPSHCHPGMPAPGVGLTDQRRRRAPPSVRPAPRALILSPRQGRAGCGGQNLPSFRCSAPERGGRAWPPAARRAV